ncbi:PREDICTED: plectin [Drosophila arizonae]|uniref:Plectin n=1 Tax=Drosophila arizonae TaxID=7263 RepID=A0ABM1Q2F1_DROAR|nr:PREDICTED: plectin [Drosophila arizonae]
MTAKAAVLLVLVCLLCPSAPQTLGHSIGKKRSLASTSLLYDDGRNNAKEGCGRKDEGCHIKLSPNAATRQKASCIAMKAAQEAKAASDAQLPAAENAALQVKIQLADKALAAANAADAALAGKLQIVEQLESEVREGELVVEEEMGSLQATQSNCNAAAQAAKQAGVQLKTLGEAVKNAQANVINSEHAANGAQQELTEKQQLVEAAKKRVELLLRQLDAARTDYRNTQKAAERAACAAQEAKQRATRERRKAEIRSKLHQHMQQ